jgi:PIN domain-containing protein
MGSARAIVRLLRAQCNEGVGSAVAVTGASGGGVDGRHFAGAALPRAVRRREIVPSANVALALEYEATCRLSEHQVAAGLTPAQVLVFVDAVIALVEPVRPHYLWHPQLRDPGEEPALAAAVNGQAEAVVTFNKRDFGAAPTRFGVALLTLPKRSGESKDEPSEGHLSVATAEVCQGRGRSCARTDYDRFHPTWHRQLQRPFGH